jgi:UDP-N-acetylmuramoylalanine--D-glutamate ligase
VLSCTEIILEAKDVAVIGLGESGASALSLLKNLKINCFGIDSATKEELEDKYPSIKNLEFSIYYKINSISDCIRLKDISCAIISPGVPLSAELVIQLENLNIPIFSELELGLSFIRGKKIIITGSNGKSTTSSLLAYLLRKSNFETRLLGNIGTAVSRLAAKEVISKEISDYIVVEASSYQLELLKSFRPDAGIFLNITPNHLERHKTIKNYCLAKANGFKRQTSKDTLILNGDNQDIFEATSSFLSKKYWFTKFKNRFLENTKSFYGYIDEESNKVFIRKINGSVVDFDLSNALLRGKHNLENMCVCLIQLELINVNLSKAYQDINLFSGLEHRLEVIQAPHQAIWINDSKSTTPEATITALATIRTEYPKKKTHLLVGGAAKTLSWRGCAQKIIAMSDQIISVCGFGKDGGNILKELQSEINNLVNITFKTFPSLDSAITDVSSALKNDELVLISPGCASFDEFKNFEDRGEFIKTRVKLL